jgi:hypothetical protein
MQNLLEIQKAADELSGEEQANLVAHLLFSFSSVTLGPDDDEIDRREIEIDSGLVNVLSYEEFLLAVDRA